MHMRMCMCMCMSPQAGRSWPRTDAHGQGGADFSLGAARLFERLAAHYGPPMRPLLLPTALSLSAAGARRDSLAVGFELLGGVLRAAGSWPRDDERQLHEELASGGFGAALRACPVESVGTVQSFLRFASASRDPRRLSWLAATLLAGLESAAAANETSLSHATALRFVAPLLAELRWRGPQLAEATLSRDSTTAAVTAGARQVREEVGALLALAMQAASPPPPGQPQPAARIGAAAAGLLRSVLAACRLEGLPRGSADASPDAASGGNGGGGVVLLEPEDEAERASARAARMVALACVRGCVRHGRPQALLPYSEQLLRASLATAASINDPDLSNAGRACAVLLAQLPLLEAGLLVPLLALLKDLSASPSWHLRGCLLPPLKYLTYLGQFAPPSLQPPPQEAIQALLLQLLVDPQLEVREAAMPVVAGYVRLYGPHARRRLLAWADNILKKRKNGGAPLAQRHGGVLGLAALVALAPYDVPSWLPEVLERLARHAQQPQPIKAAVSRVFADFKRTHQDNWAASRKQLTPEQLEMLADAEQPPHWYA
mmetsp:Transcript_20084/g.64015  ORF Transcript_20084/g.64015 Transcript_20084/m.64015 type:complete len:547 (-) Transcript_20084:339-1979(-)